MPSNFVSKTQNYLLKQFAKDEKDIAENINLGGGYHNDAQFFDYLNSNLGHNTNANGESLLPSRQSIYKLWSNMESSSIVSRALYVIVVNALGGDDETGGIVYLEPAPALKDKKTVNLIADIQKDLAVILNKVAFSVAYTGIAYGDSYARILSKKGFGVQGVYADELVHPTLINAYERSGQNVGFGIVNAESMVEQKVLTRMQMARFKMPRVISRPQLGILDNRNFKIIDNDDMHENKIYPSMVGGSILIHAEESYKNFKNSMLGLISTRLKSSVDHRIVTANMDAMTKSQRSLFMKSIQSMYKTVDERLKASMESGEPLKEAIISILPVFREKQVLNIDPQQSMGGAQQYTVEDVNFHARALSGSLGVDLSMLGFADQMSGGLGEGGYFRVSAQLSNSSMKIRTSLNEFINQVIDVHLAQKYGIHYEEGQRPWVIKYFSSNTAAAEEAQRIALDAAQTASARVAVIEAAKTLGLDSEGLKMFMMNEMKMDADEAKEYIDSFDREKANNPDAGADDGGGFGGGF